jgi:hypothetical protein
VRPEQLLLSPLVTREALIRAHSPDYVDGLLGGTLPRGRDAGHRLMQL